MKKFRILILAALAIGSFPSMPRAEAQWQGYMFGDFFFIADHHSEDAKNANGFMMRRIYNTLDFGIADNVKGRLRLEMAHEGEFPSSGDKMYAVVKDAYLSAKIGGQSLVAGISGTPTWGVIEDFWGYRSLEKTPLDLYKMGSSRDFGLALKGGDKVYYHIMFGNGNSNKEEKDVGKKFMGSLGFKPAEGLILELYADFEWDKKNSKTCNVLQGFAGYENSWGRVGAMYANRHTTRGDTKKDYGVFSGFAVVKASNKVDVIVRYDKLMNEPVAKTVSYVPFSQDALANFFI
ncbi:MAG: hypothetical protein PVI11_02510, partial [Candidatus Aminicenantes bacterium]